MWKVQEPREIRRDLKQTKPNAIRHKRRGVVLILTAVALVALIGMVGMATDLGIAYFLKARLSQAVDAAALAGARSLARGKDLASQTASAQSVATAFFNANFPNGFWGCTTSLSTPVVTENTTTKVRYVTVTASATMPLYFMRALGLNTSNLGVSGQAARRDANIMIILDRSGSMKNAVSQLVTSANWFVGQFAVNRDKVGLVTFGGTYNLIKPTASFTTSPTNVPVTISTLTSSTVAGTTDHAQPLWVAYQALAEVNEPGALNAIVFFTDGQPNTILADFVTPCVSGICNASGSNLKNPTTCNNGSTGSGSNIVYKPVIGYALVDTGGNTQGLFATASPNPPYQPDSTNPGTVPTAYVSTAYDTHDSNSSYELRSMSISSGCKFYTSGPSSVASDFKQIPAVDYYGNQTNPGTNRYKSVSLTTFNGTNLTAAAFNAADQAAQRMRAGTLNSIVPLIDTIALSTIGTAPESAYMKRLANTVDSGSGFYDPTKPTGIYVYASTTADLQSAFVQIASQILHLSQ